MDVGDLQSVLRTRRRVAYVIEGCRHDEANEGLREDCLMNGLQKPLALLQNIIFCHGRETATAHHLWPQPSRAMHSIPIPPLPILPVCTRPERLSCCIVCIACIVRIVARLPAQMKGRSLRSAWPAT
jgi:hypothetical protein